MSSKRWSSANVRLRERRSSYVQPKEVAKRVRKTSKFNVDHVPPETSKGGVFTERLESGQIAAYEVVVHEKPVETAEWLHSILSGHFVFERVDEVHVEDVVGAMRRVELAAGDALFRAGDKSSEFYVVEEGSVQAGVVFNEGETLGDASLLVDSAMRRVDGQALTDVVLWSLDRETFRLAVASLSESRASIVKLALERVPILRDLDSRLLDRLSRLVSLARYARNQRIIAKGAPGREMFVVASGRVACRDADGATGDLVLSEGDHFGERALLYDEPRAANVYALDPDTRCFVVAKAVFRAHLGQISEILEHDHKLRILDILFAGVPAEQQQLVLRVDRDALARATSLVAFGDGEVVVERGEPAAHVLVVKSGTLETEDGEVLGRGAHIGLEAALASSSTAVSYPATARASGDVECFRFAAADLQHPAKQDAAAPSTTLKARSVDEFELFRTLGVGSFGRVKLARHRATGTACALKILRKGLVVATRQKANVKSERELLVALKHPMVARCFGTFADDERLYLVLELLRGGELDGRMNETRLEPRDVAFYAANIVLALAYVHSKHVVYRDLKPDNLMVDATTGYLKLVDFGFAKTLAATEVTYTMCGTPEYIAPEVIAGSGHGKPVDYWSFGCVLFEMLSGRTPFARKPGAAPNHVLLFKAIKSSEVQFPDDIDPNAKDLVAALLAKDWHDRVFDIKAHPYFRAVDWTRLERLDPDAPPWKPHLSPDPFDDSNSNEDDEEDYDEDEVEVDPVRDNFDYWNDDD
ncbi:hypothetical protein CTAYLR_007925 [Chrysophaeum taylorii]|uniref:cGMP-dependent protein kinase n=1 Tax=Chrysophaeum taylorii TaxID=2483200 RepID=A0AAD7UB98_9STRA|nr:hypothetical protein CTAYLR_007925 [Chrysophaeum taylorii]